APWWQSPRGGSLKSPGFGLLSLQFGGVFGTHTPALHVWVQRSEQPLDPAAGAPVSGVLLQPFTTSHESAVQGLPSLQSGAMPVLQTARPSSSTHVSRPLQTVPSSHDVPAGFASWKHAG